MSPGGGGRPRRQLRPCGGAVGAGGGGAGDGAAGAAAAEEPQHADEAETRLLFWGGEGSRRCLFFVGGRGRGIFLVLGGEGSRRCPFFRWGKGRGEDLHGVCKS